MKRIVAAPTAGACGVVPAVYLTLQEQRQIDDERMLEAMYIASGVGGVIANRTWQQDCQRNDDDYFSENREKDRFFGFAQTDENRLSGELERHHKESEKV